MIGGFLAVAGGATAVLAQTSRRARVDDPQVIVGLLLLALTVICWWVLFEKAGKGGWKAIVPIYNVLVVCEVAGWPWIAALLFLVPIVSFFAWLFLNLSLARAFGRGALFGVGLWLLPIIFLPVLAFGESRYVGPGRG